MSDNIFYSTSKVASTDAPEEEQDNYQVTNPYQVLQDFEKSLYDTELCIKTNHLGAGDMIDHCTLWIARIEQALDKQQGTEAACGAYKGMFPPGCQLPVGHEGNHKGPKR